MEKTPSPSALLLSASIAMTTAMTDAPPPTDNMGEMRVTVTSPDPRAPTMTITADMIVSKAAATGTVTAPNAGRHIFCRSEEHKCYFRPCTLAASPRSGLVHLLL